MMYLSHLLIDVGDNPDRPRPGRLWLRNIYHVHQRLSMAFPSPQQKDCDPLFLSPFQRSGFESARFLFRIDPSATPESSRVMILVQSDIQPDWEYAFGLKPGLVNPQTQRPIGNAGYLLAAPPQCRQWSLNCSVGDEFRFRICVNPSKKIKQSAQGVDLRTMSGKTDAKGRQKSQSKRVSLNWDKDQDPAEAVRDWFGEKGLRCGFELGSFQLLRMGWVSGSKPGSRIHNRDEGEKAAGRPIKLRSALLEGTLRVTQEREFLEAVQSGIGAAKAFGFGLLSLTPLRR